MKKLFIRVLRGSGIRDPGFGIRDSGFDRFAVRAQQGYVGRVPPSTGATRGGPADGLDDLRDFAGPEHRVDLRNLRLELLSIPLRHAAGDDEPLALAGLLQLGHLENGVDRFLLRLVDERARVDDEHVGVGGVARELMTGLLGEPKHHLGVDEVLRAAEGDHSNLHLRRSKDTRRIIMPAEQWLSLTMSMSRRY
jgi:hypothetical protein